MKLLADLSPIEILVLARLLAAGDKGETEKTLSKDLVPLIKHRWEGQVWTDLLGTALDEFESDGVFQRIKKGKTTRLYLSDAGHKLASEALGIDVPPTKLTWAKLKAGHLPALALGRTGQPVANPKVEVLRAHYGLDLGDGKPSIPQATEKLASKLFGLEAGRKFTVDNILHKLLLDAGIAVPPGKKPSLKDIQEALFRRELGDPSARNPLDLLASRSVGARQASATELVAAVLRTWVDRSEETTTADASVPSSAGPAVPPVSLDLEEFARRVVKATRMSPSGWFGDAKVFISHVRQVLENDPAFEGMDEATFKDRLIEAHRARFLELGRADLVEAMDPADVRESATPYQNVVYHFVRTEEPAR
jgi:hypothetical protein